MDSFHRHLDELERLLSYDDMEKRRIKESILCYAVYCGSTPMVEALILKGVGKNENHNSSVETGQILVTKMYLSFGPYHHTQSALVLNFCLCTLWMSFACTKCVQAP